MSGYQNNKFSICDLGLITLVLKLDLDMTNIYHRTKMKFLCQLIQKL